MEQATEDKDKVNNLGIVDINADANVDVDGADEI